MAQTTDILSASAAVLAASRDARVKWEPVEVYSEMEADWAPETMSSRSSYVIKILTEDYLVRHVRAAIKKHCELQGGNPWAVYLSGQPIITLHECWSGYSEYTITSTWTEIEINWDGWHLYWGNTTAFFRDMAVVDPDRWD